MALPKRRHSKSRRDKRRTHQKLDAVQVNKCAKCGEAALSHHICPSCGTYKGRTVIQTAEE